MAEIDNQIAAPDTVIQIYEPDHSPTKSISRRNGTRGKFLGGLFADDNLSARILNTLRLAQTPISTHECAVRVALQKDIAEDDPRMSEISGRVSIQLSGLRSAIESSKSREMDGRLAGGLPLNPSTRDRAACFLASIRRDCATSDASRRAQASRRSARDCPRGGGPHARLIPLGSLDSLYRPS